MKVISSPKMISNIIVSTPGATDKISSWDKKYIEHIIHVLTWNGRPFLKTAQYRLLQYSRLFNGNP